MLGEQMQLLIGLVGSFAGCSFLIALLCWLVLPLDIIRNSVRGNMS